MAEEEVLGFLQSRDEISFSGKFAASKGIDHSELLNVIKSLHGFRLTDAQIGSIPTSWIVTDFHAEMVPKSSEHPRALCLGKTGTCGSSLHLHNGGLSFHCGIQGSLC